MLYELHIKSLLEIYRIIQLISGKNHYLFNELSSEHKQLIYILGWLILSAALFPVCSVARAADSDGCR